MLKFELIQGDIMELYTFLEAAKDYASDADVILSQPVKSSNLANAPIKLMHLVKIVYTSTDSMAEFHDLMHNKGSKKVVQLKPSI